MTTDAPERVVQTVDPRRLAGLNRLTKQSPIHESINHEYYTQPSGWVVVAEGHETLQAKRLVDVKGYSRILGVGRPNINAEMLQPFHVLLRTPKGCAVFPPEQIVTFGWHDAPPFIFTCREQIDEMDHPEHTPDCFTQARFPQMQGVQVYRAGCGICHKRFATTQSQELAENFVKKHMEVSHKDNLQNAELVSGLAKALSPMVTAQGASGGGLTPEMLQQIAQVAAMAAVAAIQQTVMVTAVNEEPTGAVVDAVATDEGTVKKK